jgi:hypothetical protein
MHAKSPITLALLDDQIGTEEPMASWASTFFYFATEGQLIHFGHVSSVSSKRINMLVIFLHEPGFYNPQAPMTLRSLLSLLCSHLAESFHTTCSNRSLSLLRVLEITSRSNTVADSLSVQAGSVVLDRISQETLTIQVSLRHWYALTLGL